MREKYYQLFVGGVKMKRFMMYLVVVLAAASWCGATIVPINDFESYADSAALQAEWAATANLTRTLDTTDVHGGINSMKYTGSTWNSPWYLKAEYRLPGIVWGTSGQDWNDTTALSMWVKPTASKGNFKIILVDCYGNNLYSKSFGVLPTGSWIELSCDLTAADTLGHVLTKDELGRIGRIDLVAKKETALYPNSQDGTNTYYIDDITRTVIPEPATMSLLGLGALAFFRRR